MKNDTQVERISEIDSRAFEIEGTEGAVNDYLASKDPDYLRQCEVTVTRNVVTSTVIVRVKGLEA